MFKSEAPSVEAAEIPLKQEIVEEEPASTLLKLKSEEANLMEEKQELESLREKLQLKAKEEIENKKSSLQKLKAEITDLKVVCEKLNKSLNVGVAAT